jgi:hypothetical protein
MAKFIELKSGKETYCINVSHIVVVKPKESGKATIYFLPTVNNWGSIDVDSTYDEVLGLIRE